MLCEVECLWGGSGDIVGKGARMPCPSVAFSERLDRGTEPLFRYSSIRSLRPPSSLSQSRGRHSGNEAHMVLLCDHSLRNGCW